MVGDSRSDTEVRGRGRRRGGAAAGAQKSTTAGSASSGGGPKNVPASPQPVLTVNGPFPRALAVAAFRAACALDAKTSPGDPLLSEVAAYLERITQAVLGQSLLQKDQLVEALSPVLTGCGWEDERVSHFCNTCWDAAGKPQLKEDGKQHDGRGRSGSGLRARSRQPGNDYAEETKHDSGNLQTRRPVPEDVHRAREALAEFAAGELSREEDLAKSQGVTRRRRLEQRKLRSARKERNLTATGQQPAADEAQDSLSDNSTGHQQPKRSSNRFNVLNQADAQDSSTSGGVGTYESDRCKWTVKSYKNGTETTWKVSESPNGHLGGMRIVGKQPVVRLSEPSDNAETRKQNEREKSSRMSLTLSHSETGEEEQSMSMMRTLSEGTGSRLMDVLDDERSRKGDGDWLEGLSEGVGEEGEGDDAEDEPEVGPPVAWQDDMPIPSRPDSSRSGSSLQSPIGTPAGLSPALPSAGLLAKLFSQSGLPPFPNGSRQSAPVGRTTSDASGVTERPMSAPSRPPKASSCPPSPAGSVAHGLWPMPLGPGHPRPCRVRSADQNSSGSLFSRQISQESFATDHETLSAAGTPARLWPTTPESFGFKIPAANFMLPPLHTSFLTAGGFPTMAPEGDTSGREVIYVPVFVPHRCRNCGHDCMPEQPLKVQEASSSQGGHFPGRAEWPSWQSLFSADVSSSSEPPADTRAAAVPASHPPGLE
ncbi:unnamed protein product [Polarella glacialis]|uniref:Uncharacterized protein n=1 Tax=Polarella glacialis TaxID=89957 RepID=A0A813DCB5_POLGL|nr:unnamed protein product [Polarella glacialis]